MLGMPAPRVRQLAREALGELSPRSAARVDGDWRGQIADYLLGQQTGPEGTATRGHLKRSEPARLWALSLLDSLDHLYDERDLPVIPEGEAAPLRERERGAPSGARARPSESAPGASAERAERPARPLSADAETIVRRRRIAGAAAAATALLFILLVWPVGLLTGDDDDGGGGDTSAEAEEQPRVLGQLLLRPQSGEKGVGIALITERDGERSLLVQARGLQPHARGPGLRGVALQQPGRRARRWAPSSPTARATTRAPAACRRTTRTSSSSTSRARTWTRTRPTAAIRCCAAGSTDLQASTGTGLG